MKGAARVCIETARPPAVSAEIARVSLSVEIGNPALRLYERCGFRRVGRVGGAFTQVADARR